MILTKSVSYNFGIATLSRLLINALSLVLVIILTRYLGPSAFGHYSAAMAYIFIVGIFAGMGLHLILVREISRHDEEESVITSKLFTLRLILVIGITLIAVLIAQALPYEPEVNSGIMIVALFLILSSMVQLLMGLFQKHLNVYLVSIADIIARIVQLGLTVLLVVTDKLTLMWVFWIVVLSEVVHFVIVFLWARRLTQIKWMVDTEYWKRILRTSLPVAASLLFTLLYFRIDTVFLSLMRSAEEVGHYAVAYKVLEMTIFIPALYIGLIMPLMSKQAFHNIAQFKNIFRRAFDILAVMAFPAVVFLFLTAGQIVHIIGGNEFLASGPLLKILTIAIFAIFFGNLGGHALIALNLQVKGMWIYLGGAVINIVTNAIFIPRYGASAAAWTTVATEVFVVIAMFVIIYKSSNTGIPLFRFGRCVLAALIMGIIVLPFTENFVIALIAGLTYIPIVFLLGGIKTQDIRGALKFNQ
ncbi:MAG: flippase [Parcubacteria group bacterium]